MNIIINSRDFSMTAVAEKIKTYLVQNNCSSGTILEIRLVVEEIVTNCVNHGYDTFGDIELDLSIENNRIDLKICDSGCSFDPLQHKVQGLDDDFVDRNIGGMGIHLVKEIMDSVSYERKDGKNILRTAKSMVQG